MFESRLQTAQFFLAVSTVLTVIAILVFIFGPVVVGVFCLVLQAVAAAAGCYLYAEVKGYPGPIGMAIGVAFGAVGALFIMIMPDQVRETPLERERRLAKLALKINRDNPGYEVLDDEDDLDDRPHLRRRD
jgi:hypothetical protein